MSRIMKIVLFIVFFAVFFEAGLISSYTIVTSQPPDVGKLIGMQVDEITSFLSFGSGTNILNTQSNKKINNPDEVAEVLKTKGGLDGINLSTLSAQVSGTSDEDIIPVNITVMGYKDSVSGGNSSGGQIVITANETYSLTATAMATLKNSGIVIDVSTIQITSSRKLYGSTNGT